MSSAANRPTVTVVMPFAGDADDAERALQALQAIVRRAGDEVIVADNSAGLTFAAVAESDSDVRVLPATEQRSSYYARNVAAGAAGNDWLLFLDSDCIPDPNILDHYFDPAPAPDEGAIAGEITADPAQTNAVARYQRDRAYLSQRRHVYESDRPFAVTANLLVRRQAWRSVGGFLEGIRSGGDSEFSWRLQDAGWRIGYRPQATVVHHHREDIRSLAEVILRYGAGRAWLNRRYPGVYDRVIPRDSVLRALAAATRWWIGGDRERARFRAIDAAVISLNRVAPLLPNTAGRAAAARPAVAATAVFFVDRFPELSETFIASELSALARASFPVRVEAVRRAERQDLTAAHLHHVDYSEDDPPLRKARALLALVTAHPIRCAADLVARVRWRREEPVPPLRVIAPIAGRLGPRETWLHAHFAGAAALTAMRIARLTGRQYSVTAHAYEIFREPRNLVEKLEGAAFVTTGCLYNVEHLRRLAPRARVHEVVMGVDGGRFRRQTPYPGGRGVVAVGRLVEKKGFAHLIEAVARLEASDPVERLQIIGDGPLRNQLREQISALGLEHRVELFGALEHDAVRVALERADVLAMPCVVADDGDRDSMPVVVKEALALEIPVVASDEVGLPELVKPAWGRLVPPGDSSALAEAIGDLLALPPAERAEMGRAGRAHVLESCNVDREAAKLTNLMHGRMRSEVLK